MSGLGISEMGYLVGVEYQVWTGIFQTRDTMSCTLIKMNFYQILETKMNATHAKNQRFGTHNHII